MNRPARMRRAWLLRIRSTAVREEEDSKCWPSSRLTLQCFLLDLQLWPSLDIVVAIEVLMSIDPDLENLAEIRKRMPVVEQNIGILTHLQGADALVDHQLFRRIDSD